MSKQLTLRLTPEDEVALEAAAIALAGRSGARHINRTACIRVAISELLARREDAAVSV